jgi:hypothetical protein
MPQKIPSDAASHRDRSMAASLLGGRDHLAVDAVLDASRGVENSSFPETSASTSVSVSSSGVLPIVSSGESIAVAVRVQSVAIARTLSLQSCKCPGNRDRFDRDSQPGHVCSRPSGQLLATGGIAPLRVADHPRIRE